MTCALEHHRTVTTSLVIAIIIIALTVKRKFTMCSSSSKPSVSLSLPGMFTTRVIPQLLTISRNSVSNEITSENCYIPLFDKRCGFVFEGDDLFVPSTLCLYMRTVFCWGNLYLNPSWVILSVIVYAKENIPIWHKNKQDSK